MVMGIESMFGLGEVEEKDTLKELPLKWIFPFPNQPFELYSNERVKELADDIKNRGLDNPIIVRKIEEEHYQIISGHNRFEAIKLLNWNRVPVSIKKLNDEQAMIYLVQSNLLQRTKIKESEKVKAYSLRAKALKKQGQKGIERYNSIEKISESEDIKPRTLSRYIACSKLIPELLDFLDKKKISLNIGEQLSKLDENIQQQVSDFITNYNRKLSLKEVKMIEEESNKDNFSLDTLLLKNSIKNEMDFDSSLNRIYGKLKATKTFEEYKETNKINDNQVFELLKLLIREKCL